MFSTRNEQLASGHILKFAIDQDSSPLPYADVLRLWQTDATLRSFFMTLLADAPFSAFRWETPALTNGSAQRPFEFVILESPGLAAKPDPNAFADHFEDATRDSVVSFPNLGNDAILIVPCPSGPLSAYRHIAAFVREAPEPQKHALWALVGKRMEQRLGPKPVWLSTAGAGVSWLHVRLDDKPKYYGHAPYRKVS
jgi:hypothetical protein